MDPIGQARDSADTIEHSCLARLDAGAGGSDVETGGYLLLAWWQRRSEWRQLPAGAETRSDWRQGRRRRIDCRRLAAGAVAGVGNKPGYIDLLLKNHRDKVDGEAVATGPTKETPKQTEWRVSQHDTFLLVNIVFSEAFIDRMSEADNNQNRSTIDTHAVNEESQYWKDITRIYNEEHEKHKGLVASRQ
ncbi:hypothetical protein PR002_g9945 [Phytophthora rubi]|uniref:Uncharacterized protein n=2 Tax=Phytophthora rubi TaxID=129364 RepID=A0A6A3MF94_9STRA|nr:hypothetical protein PR002_g9945 [Phytophthora rubi]